MLALQRRAFSFAAIALIYLIAAIAGILLCRHLRYVFWMNLLLADIAATVIVYLFSVFFGNASVYDPYWSVQPIVIVTAAAVIHGLTPVRVQLLLAVWFWGVRLTGNWAYTFEGLDHQDWRYTMLREQTGPFYPFVNFLGIHLVPTLIVYGCVLPAVCVFRDPAAWNLGSLLFCLLSVGAVVLQGTADRQMHRFRSRHTGGLIREGLWKYARHPNYLGEILMWWGVALSAVCVMPMRWYLCAGAFANTLLFLFVSIPMADKRQSGKPGFAEYREETRVLLPLKRS